MAIVVKDKRIKMEPRIYVLFVFLFELHDECKIIKNKENISD